jgi:hypothetical protein
MKNLSDNLLADSHNILNSWKNFSQLLNLHIRRIEIHTSETLVPVSYPLEVEIDIAKFENYKSPVSVQILAELIQAVGEILLSAIHRLINSVWNMEKLPDQWKESIIVPAHKKSDKTDCNNYRVISLLSTSYNIL